MFFPCSELIERIELVIQWTMQYFVTLWVSWCKNKSFWQRLTCISVSASLFDENFDDVILLQFKDFWGIFSFNPFSIHKKSEVPEAVTSSNRVLFKWYAVSFISSYNEVQQQKLDLKQSQWPKSCNTYVFENLPGERNIFRI